MAPDKKIPAMVGWWGWVGRLGDLESHVDELSCPHDLVCTYSKGAPEQLKSLSSDLYCIVFTKLMQTSLPL